MKTKIFLFIILLVSFFTHGGLVVHIDGAKFKPLPIAIAQFDIKPTNFSTSKEVAKKLRQKLNTNLAMSGVFKVISKKSFIVNAKKEGFALKGIKFRSWSAVGADALIKIKLSMQKQKIIADLYAYQVGLRKGGFYKRYSSDKNDLRALSNNIADGVYRYYTGEISIFHSKIAATKESGKQKYIVLIDFDGKNERIIANHSDLNILPSLAKNGDYLLYSSYKNNQSKLFKLSLHDNKHQLVSARKGLNVSGNFSPNGQMIALTSSKDGNSEIYICDQKCNRLKRLTYSWGIDTSASFSPDGKQIVFVSSRSGSPQIYLMNTDGSKQRRLTFLGNYNQSPRWSPKGNFIVFCGRDEKYKYDIFLYNLNTQNIHRITQDQGNNEDPWFSPSGRQIIFTSTRTGKRELFIANLDGDFQKQISHGGNYYTPSWSK